MNCQMCRIEIEESGVNASLSDGARAHLSACQVCRAFHDERQALKRLVGSLEAVSAPPDFDFRLRARINAAKATGNHRSSWRSFLASAPAIGLAASFALLVAGVVFYRQVNRTAPAAEQPSAIANIQKPEQVTTNPVPAVQTTQVSDENKNSDVTTVVAKNRRPRASGGQRGARREASQMAANTQQPVVSNEMSSRAAPQIIAGSASPLRAQNNAIVEFSVRSSSQPMRVSVDDRGGAKRTVTLEPVVFGSQDLIGRNSSRPATSQGIW